jgi:hypothetical protein
LIQICHKSLSAKTIPRREPGVWPVFARVFAFFGPRKTPRPSGQVNQQRAAVPKELSGQPRNALDMFVKNNGYVPNTYYRAE